MKILNESTNVLCKVAHWKNKTWTTERASGSKWGYPIGRPQSLHCLHNMPERSNVYESLLQVCVPNCHHLSHHSRMTILVSLRLHRKACTVIELVWFVSFCHGSAHQRVEFHYGYRPRKEEGGDRLRLWERVDRQKRKKRQENEQQSRLGMDIG